MFAICDLVLFNSYKLDWLNKAGPFEVTGVNNKHGGISYKLIILDPPIELEFREDELIKYDLDKYLTERKFNNTLNDMLSL